MISTADHKTFEEQYISLRRKEGRLYTDEEVSCLPHVSAQHPLQKEWQIRKASCQRLVRHLAKKRRPLQIMEIGCGNGWLCNRLSKIPAALVTGVDINETELAQAKRVFPQLTFLHGDVRDGITKDQFDVVVFAASIQYFPSVKELIERCFENLNSDGEIHIVDTHFYSDEDAAKAEQRSRDYFITAGFPQMKNFYFHHSATELNGFYYKFMFQSRSFFNRLFQRNPFPWICIKK